MENPNSYESFSSSLIQPPVLGANNLIENPGLLAQQLPITADLPISPRVEASADAVILANYDQTQNPSSVSFSSVLELDNSSPSQDYVEETDNLDFMFNPTESDDLLNSKGVDVEEASTPDYASLISITEPQKLLISDDDSIEFDLDGGYGEGGLSIEMNATNQSSSLSTLSSLSSISLNNARDLGNLTGKRFETTGTVTSSQKQLFKFKNDEPRFFQAALKDQLQDASVNIFDSNGKQINLNPSQFQGGRLSEGKYGDYLKILLGKGTYFVEVKTQLTTPYRLAINLLENANITNIFDANLLFGSQIKSSTFNPGGPTSSTNCGPATLAMMLRAEGFFAGVNPETTIDHLRFLGRGGSTGTRDGLVIRDRDNESGLSVDELDKAARAAGAKDVKRASGFSTGASWDSIFKAVDQGYKVAVNGYYDAEWRGLFGSLSNTWNATGGHWLAILGKDSSGKYLVADPMSKIGVVSMTKDQLKIFNDGKNQRQFPYDDGTPGLLAIKA